MFNQENSRVKVELKEGYMQKLHIEVICWDKIKMIEDKKFKAKI